ncbi:homocysteine S-methyltransferase [Streptomyces filamentosus]|uniref:Homocysteine S-methyltransferase n=1 Tax=Streptomyces filamentosus TaxID=67294 RepID=A0A919BBN7_STRFL|nr:homocysteine S-methyltransferase [Streptomyces filamentosus]GHF81012.1 homocysteine S-methyltransferase [Streptomyces filamentosus]
MSPTTPARPPAPAFAQALAEGVLVLDGGLSRQLEAQGCDLSGALWSARLLADAPEQLGAAHAAYLRAGAGVLTTAGYQATFEGFARRGLDRRAAAGLLARSVTLAREAAAAEPGTWVAASVGPYGAMLADGSEYRGRYGLSVRELVAFHRPRMEAFAAAGPDVLALETVPDAEEAEALLRAAEGCGVPVWLSYTVAGGRTRAGQALAEAFAVAAGNDQVVAVGVNCCDPAEAADAVAEAVAVTGRPAVVYPDSGERWDAAARDWRGAPAYGPATAPRLAAAWAKAGARLIGGCCRTGPETIAALAEWANPGPGPESDPGPEPIPNPVPGSSPGPSPAPSPD